MNNQKVSAHHAIIPTAKNKATGVLSSNEEKIYELVARQYIAQFYPNFEYSDKQIDTVIAGGLFTSKQKDVIHQGWKTLFPTKNKTNAEFSTLTLPNVKVDDSVQCNQGNLVEKYQPTPSLFTDATLLSALTGIARFVTDAEIKR